MAFDRGTGGSQTGSASITSEPVPIPQGGTGATTAQGARQNLGLKGMAQQEPQSVSILGGSIEGISPPIAIVSGGTGANNAVDARANLGVGFVGTQNDTDGIPEGSTKLFYTDARARSAFSVTGSLSYDSNTGVFSITQGTIASQDANNVNITGGSIAGITDLAVADGGTGASTSAEALANLLPSYAGNANRTLAVNGTADGVVWSTAGAGDVVGPSSSTDGTVVLFDGTSGKLIKSGGALGTAAFSNTGDFATATQGSKADTALQPTDIGSTVQGYDGDLNAIASLTGTTGLLKKTAANTWSLDTNTYLTSETDPVYVASSWYSTTNNASNWDTAYSWGDHSVAGYLTSFTETDPVFSAHPAHNVTSTNLSDWTAAYNDKINSASFDTATGTLTLTQQDTGTVTASLDGRYLTSFTETDPVFSVSPAAGITTTQISNWDTAYGWGNHASAGYALDSAVVKLSGDQTVAGTKTFSSTIVGDITGNAGTVTNGVYTTGSYSDPSWITLLSETKVLPSQTGNSGKYLTTNGTSTSWATVDALPSQTGNTGKYLTTDGTVASWDDLAAVANSGSYNDLSNTPTLGTISSQDANNVNITGGSITGITDLAVADGGTGSSTASGARVNLLPSYTGNAGKVLGVNTGATDVEWISAGGGQFEGTAANKAIMWNAQTIDENITIVGTHNAGSFGPITISSGYTVTINSGAVWTIV